MNRKHNTQQVFESQIRSAVEREAPDRKDTLLAELTDRTERTPDAGFVLRHPVLKYAVSFAVIALTVGGALVLPQTLHPAETDSLGSAAAQAQQNPFVLTAYAAQKDVASSGGIPFGLTLTRPVSISGIDCSGYARTEDGGSIYDSLELLKEDGTNQVYGKYVGFNLQCVGKHIQSVTFTTDRGGFAQIKNLTEEEHSKIINSIPYIVEKQKEQKSDYEQHPEKYAGKHATFTIGTPNPDYGDGKSLEVAAGGWGPDKNQIEYYGYLPVGASYTIAYDKQDDYRIQYALRLPLTYPKKNVENWDKTDIRELNHRASQAIAGTVVTVTANYEDGSKATKKCVLTLDPKTWIFTAVEQSD